MELYGRSIRVLLSGAEYSGGLAAVRALRSAGFEPWVADPVDGSYGALSRAAAGSVRVTDPRIDPLAFTEELVEAADRIGARVVLPGTEPALLALGEHRGLFPDDVAVGAPPPELTIAATDKQSLAQRAADAGFAVPPTELITLDDLRGGRTDQPYPVVVKPVRSELADASGLQRYEVVRARDPRELAAALEVLPGKAALVQPYLIGPIRTVNGVAWDGEVVASVHKLAERTWPLDCGVVCYARTVPIEPDVDRAARALLGDLGWSGLFNLQMISTPDGHHVIDLNPRVYHSLALAVDAGANLPAIWTALLLGERPPFSGYRVGVRFRSEEDVMALWGTFRAGRRAAALRGLVPHRGTSHAVLSLRDPAPTLNVLRRAVRVARRRGSPRG
ncbi:carboxylate--amine ligase [Pseudonocardia thermophila]|uniref:carboxylate--amine ligase n=1 Tax=Pseudonocardia thermophila TaxID=1848 RepID=UPI0013563160|nr:ATP-grasp domain-containing protein [Pseudonocardia thermophila]